MRGGKRAKPSRSQEQVAVLLEMTEDRALVPTRMILVPADQHSVGQGRKIVDSRLGGLQWLDPG